MAQGANATARAAYLATQLSCKLKLHAYIYTGHVTACTRHTSYMLYTQLATVNHETHAALSFS